MSVRAVGARLRQTREALGLNQAAIARLTGISPQSWNNYERALFRISIDHALRLCTTTGVSLDWVYRGDMRGLPLDLALKIQQAPEATPQRA